MSTCLTQKRRNFNDAGRVCPVDYRISEELFDGEPEYSADTLYVVGGLYGNLFALDALDELVSAEEGNVLVVLNGDIHWFDKTAQHFLRVEQRVRKYLPLVGNVELELRRTEDLGVGCGCSYPDCTSDADVSRSNRIHSMLAEELSEYPELIELLEDRPATTTVDVVGKKIAITHGDEQLIGGWGCSRESLQDIVRQHELDEWMAAHEVDVLATTHTCAPVALTLDRGALINNGAAGMPNFSGDDFGLVTRISQIPAQESAYGVKLDEVYVEAVPLRYDSSAFARWFDETWSLTSPASISYRQRIVEGPEDQMEKALLGGFEVGSIYTQQTIKEVARDEVDLALAQVMYFEDLLEPEHRQTVEQPTTLQVNVGALCNLSCEHCHMEAGPHRTEVMTKDCFDAILSVVKQRSIATVDITGGAPELNPHFTWFITELAWLGVHTVVRTNAVVLLTPRCRHLFDLYADLGVELVVSLPHFFDAQANSQRGRGIYAQVIEVLRILNKRGYGKDDRLVLNLAFNPQWPVLPPKQDELEAIFRERLEKNFGIVFNNLYVIANNPIGRYGQHLIAEDDFEEYMELLLDSYNEEARDDLMCRHQVSVAYDGTIYDCDFNQVAGLSHDLTIFDYAKDPALPLSRIITFGNHCYACTAGQGSSCTGTLVKE